ncbi:membrane-spanning 4-domains subfamily A member 4A-like isoform X1 [Lithobates pipiens]
MAVPYISFHDNSPWNSGLATPHVHQGSVSHRTFLKVKPRAIGVSQITLAIFQIALGINCAIFSPSCYSSYIGYNFWGPLSFIFAGCITITATTRTALDLVKGSIALNISNVFIAVTGITLSSFDVSLIPDHTSDPYRSMGGTIAILALLLTTNVLQLILAIPMFIAGCCSLRHNSIGSSQVYVIPADFPPHSPLPPPYSLEPPVFTDPPPSYSSIS